MERARTLSVAFSHVWFTSRRAAGGGRELFVSFCFFVYFVFHCGRTNQLVIDLIYFFHSFIHLFIYLFIYSDRAVSL